MPAQAGQMQVGGRGGLGVGGVGWGAWWGGGTVGVGVVGLGGGTHATTRRTM